MFDLLRLVNCLLLANRPVEIDRLLLQGCHRRGDLRHEDLWVFQTFISLGEYFVLQDTKVISLNDLAL